MANYRQGTLVTVQASFKDVTGTLTDPSSVAMSWRDPLDVIHAGSPTKSSTGIWAATIDTTPYAGGTVVHKWTGSGAVQVVAFDSFGIEPVSF